jgi:hypothetical protein
VKRVLLSVLLLATSAACSRAANFDRPVRLKAGDAAIRTESPGVACPCWADIKGQKTLLVGQFADGKIRLFKHIEAEKFTPGEWLKADGKVAQVPGVW